MPDQESHAFKDTKTRTELRNALESTKLANRMLTIMYRDSRNTVDKLEDARYEARTEAEAYSRLLHKSDARIFELSSINAKLEEEVEIREAENDSLREWIEEVLDENKLMRTMIGETREEIRAALALARNK